MTNVYFVSELHNYRKGFIKCWPPKFLGKKERVPAEWENIDDRNYVKYGNYFGNLDDAQEYFDAVNGMKLNAA